MNFDLQYLEIYLALDVTLRAREDAKLLLPVTLRRRFDEKIGILRVEGSEGEELQEFSLSLLFCDQM